MKRVIFLGDGMADEPLPVLNGKTPLEAAYHPCMDRIASDGVFGHARTVPHGMEAGSDVANLSVFGFDPRKYYTGRSPLEALSLGIDLKSDDVTYRCNLVTLSDEKHIEDAVMIDYSSGEITSSEASELIRALQAEYPTLYAGTSYRNLLVLHAAKTGAILAPPHDITGKRIESFFPKGSNEGILNQMIRQSYSMLRAHPVNLRRLKESKRQANCVWFWGEGTKPQLPNFHNEYGLKGAVISAVDLIKGIGKGLGMDIIEVAGATGNYDTDFSEKGKAVIRALRDGWDYVYVHVEAPDECGHQRLAKEKIYSIEMIDSQIIKPVMNYLEGIDEQWSVLVMPDHPTPCTIGSHTAEPVPYAILKSGDRRGKNLRFCESDAKKFEEEVVPAHNLLALM